MAGDSAPFTLVDPRPIAAEAPYTYFLPTAERLAAFGAEDLVQMVFQSTASGVKWDAERMWVRVTSTEGARCRGRLENEPYDMPGLTWGGEVVFERWHVISVIFSDPETCERFLPSAQSKYWDRCLVDQAVLDGELQVDYLYREDPDLGDPDDEFPDSGWRIRGDMRKATDAEIEAREPIYVAIGKVLNRDDSWLSLIDEPVGSAFRRNFETGQYEPVAPDDTSLH